MSAKLFDARKIQFHGSRTPENRHRNFQAAVIVVNFLDIATHRTTRVFDLGNRPAWGAPGLAISSDKKTILYTQLDALNSDIILVENFR